MKFNLLLWLYLFSFNESMATINTIHSIKDGLWNDSTVWSTQSIPQPIDSIFVHHHVTFTENLLINSGGLLRIDTSAILCGMDTIKSVCGGFFYNYGIVKAAALILTDGSNYGVIYWSYMETIGPCYQTFAAGESHGGYPYSCDFTAILTPGSNLFHTNIYPNPFTEQLTIETFLPDAYTSVVLNIYDILGRRMKSIPVPIGNTTQSVFASDWAAGMYLIRFERGRETLFDTKVIRVK